MVRSNSDISLLFLLVLYFVLIPVGLARSTADILDPEEETGEANRLRDRDLYLRIEAAELCTVNNFLSSLRELARVPAEEAAQAQEFVNDLRSSRISHKGVAGIVKSLPLASYRELIDHWAAGKYIDNETQEALKAESSAQLASKFIEETVFNDDRGRVVYGIVGFVRQNPAGQELAVAYVFRRVHFKIPMEVKFLSTRRYCVYNGIMCTEKISLTSSVRSFSEAEAEHIRSYMKNKALQLFEHMNGPVIAFLNIRAQQLLEYLPAEKQSICGNLEKSVKPSDAFTDSPTDSEHF